MRVGLKTGEITSRTRLSNIVPVDPKISKINLSRTTYVLYVTKENAKTLKIALEEESFLDKSYRMTKADASELIAVPVTNACLAAMAENEAHDDVRRYSWMSLIVDTGVQAVPFSTAVMGRKQN